MIRREVVLIGDLWVLVVAGFGGVALRCAKRVRRWRIAWKVIRPGKD